MAFYRDTLGLEVQGRDAYSDAFRMENVYFQLLAVSTTAALIGEEDNAQRLEGEPRGLLAASVEDVDATYETLKAKDVTFLRPPTDQSWGLRTAHFADPEGSLWKINLSIASKSRGRHVVLWYSMAIAFVRASAQGMAFSSMILTRSLGVMWRSREQSIDHNSRSIASR